MSFLETQRLGVKGADIGLYATKQSTTRPTALVIGTGRSGTSSVARILHERIGICMGHYMIMRESNLWGGQYEDLLTHGMNQMIRKQNLAAAALWLNVVAHSHEDRGCRKWGAKDHWFAYWPLGLLRLVAPKLIVLTWRPLSEIMDSWARLWQRWHEKEHGKPMADSDVEQQLSVLRPEMAERARRLEAIMESDLPTIRICFDGQRVPDEEIERQIREGLSE